MVLGLKPKPEKGSIGSGGRNGEEKRRDLAPAGWGIAGGSIAAVVMGVLLQMGLIGPAARGAALESERRMTRVETQVEALGRSLDTTRNELLAEIRGLRVDLRRKESNP